MFSSVLNLHQPKKQLPEKGNNTFSHSVWRFPKIYPHFMCMSSLFVVKNMIPLSSLDSLMQWGRRHYGYLFDNSSLHQKSQSVFCSTKFLHECSSFFIEIVNFLASCDLGKEALIHFRAKVLSLISDRVILVADEPGIEIHLYLWVVYYIIVPIHSFYV